jgi:hypothetical protein
MTESEASCQGVPYCNGGLFSGYAGIYTRELTNSAESVGETESPRDPRLPAQPYWRGVV